MALNNISDEDLERYLLGDMPQPARTALEDRYLSDDEIHERLLAIEEELIDRQVHGLLSPAQWDSLKKSILLGEDGPERLSFAHALARLHRQRHRDTQLRFSRVLRQWSSHRALVPSAIGAAILLACAILWRDFHSETVRLEPTNRGSGHTDESIARNLPQTVRPRAVTLFLRSVSRDKSAGNILRIPGGYARVVLEAEFHGDERKSYHATIRPVDSEQIHTSNTIEKHAATQPGSVLISAEFSAEFLKDGDYIFTVFMETENQSAEEIMAYTFSVARTPSF